MKKIIFSKEVRIEKNIEEWSVREVAKQINLKLTFNRFPKISDQEIEVWETYPEPYNLTRMTFKIAFSEYIKNLRGE